MNISAKYEPSRLLAFAICVAVSVVLSCIFFLNRNDSSSLFFYFAGLVGGGLTVGGHIIEKAIGRAKYIIDVVLSPPLLAIVLVVCGFIGPDVMSKMTMSNRQIFVQYGIGYFMSASLLLMLRAWHQRFQRRKGYDPNI